MAKSAKKANLVKEAISVKKNNKDIFIIIGVLIACIALISIVIGVSNSKTETVSQGGDITILKSDITETAKFIPYKVGNTNRIFQPQDIEITPTVELS
jgi:hypothetical protein